MSQTQVERYDELMDWSREDLVTTIIELEARLRQINDMLIEVRREYRPAGARGQQLTAVDALEAYMRSLPRYPSYEQEHTDELV